MDRLELMRIVLNHPEADLRVEVGHYLLDVQGVAYCAEREAVVLVLDPEDVQELMPGTTPA